VHYHKISDSHSSSFTLHLYNLY